MAANGPQLQQPLGLEQVAEGLDVEDFHNDVWSEVLRLEEGPYLHLALSVDRLRQPLVLDLAVGCSRCDAGSNS